jgi:hypothetical protein
MPTIPLKDWIYCGIIVLLIAGGLWYHHHVLELGIADQIAADNKATAKVQAQAQVQTKALQTQADAAEHAHDQELADLTAYRNAHPDQPVRLCLTAHPGSGGLPQTGTPDTKHAGSSASVGNLQQMPTGDRGSGEGTAGPDISGMLSALGARADQLSAELREFQAR